MAPSSSTAKIIRVVVGGVVIVFGELIVSWVPRCSRGLLFPLALKIQVVLLVQLVQTLAVLPGGQQSATCSEGEYQPNTWWFLVGRCVV